MWKAQLAASVPTACACLLEAKPQAPEGLAGVGPCFFDFPSDTPQYNCEFPDRLIFSFSIFSLLFITIEMLGRICKHSTHISRHPEALAAQVNTLEVGAQDQRSVSPSPALSHHLIPRGRPCQHLHGHAETEVPRTAAAAGQAPPRLSAPARVSHATPHCCQEPPSPGWRSDLVSTPQVPPSTMAQGPCDNQGSKTAPRNVKGLGRP